jgi:hypothetical protein
MSPLSAVLALLDAAAPVVAVLLAWAAVASCWSLWAGPAAPNEATARLLISGAIAAAVCFVVALVWYVRWER